MNELARAILFALGTTATHTPAWHAPWLRGASWHDATPAVVKVQPRDAWLGPDKFRHFWTSYAATAFVFAGARAAGINADASLTASLGVGMIAGIGKEMYDRRHGQSFSVRDLVADALGLGAAYVLLRQVR